MTEGLAPDVEARLDEVPRFAAQPRTVEALTGGLTNLNLKVTTPEGSYVARLSNDHGDLLAIDREAEYRNSLAAAESGMAPAVVDYLPGRGVLVVAWVEGRTYEPADVREPANIPRLADACRTLHSGPRFANDFDMFTIQRGYLALVQERGFRLPDARLYVRAELSSVLCGGWEAEALSLDPRPGHGASGTVDVAPSADWDVLASFADALEPFVPGVTAVGVRQTFRGWPAFTPDGRFVVGPVSGLRGFVMAAGCNAHGVSGSAGLAQHLVESLQPEPSPYVRSLSPARFLDGGWTWEDARRRAQRHYEDYYVVSRPATAPPVDHQEPT